MEKTIEAVIFDIDGVIVEVLDKNKNFIWTKNSAILVKGLL